LIRNFYEDAGFLELGFANLFEAPSKVKLFEACRAYLVWLVHNRGPILPFASLPECQRAATEVLRSPCPHSSPTHAVQFFLIICADGFLFLIRAFEHAM